MTEIQRSKIFEMRADDISYKQIADTIGLSVDSVKGYCKRNHLTGDIKIVKLNSKLSEKRTDVCLMCKNPISQKSLGTVRKFCSDECRRTWWKQNPEKCIKNENAIYKFICKYCGRESESYGNSKRNFCSHDCYVKFRFFRKGNENE